MAREIVLKNIKTVTIRNGKKLKGNFSVVYEARQLPRLNTEGRIVAVHRILRPR